MRSSRHILRFLSNHQNKIIEIELEYGQNDIKQKLLNKHGENQKFQIKDNKIECKKISLNNLANYKVNKQRQPYRVV